MSMIRLKRFFSWAVSAEAFLLGVLIAFVSLWLACPQVFIASDPWAYSARAFAIADRFDFGANHVFSHRLGVTVPVGLVYWLLGVDILTTNFWPLCAALLIVVVIWSAVPDAKGKIAGGILGVTSVPLLKASVVLLPDIVAAAFMAWSSLILFRRERCCGTDKPRWAPPLAVALLFCAFLAKESAYWILPLWISALYSDTRALNHKMEMRDSLLSRFHLPAWGYGAVLGAAYLGFCSVVWGDPFARFKGIEAVAGSHLWSWSGSEFSEITKRLTISPVRLYATQYGVSVLFLSVIGSLFGPREIKPWVNYSVCCVLFYWFGSTSFSHYQPMPLMERMTLPVLPGLYVLAASGASHLITTIQRSKKGYALALGIVATLPIGYSFARYLHSWGDADLSESAAMQWVTRDMASHPSQKFLLLCSDTRSPDSLSFYFGYRYPSNLTVTSVGAVTEPQFQSIDKWYVFVHRERSAFLMSSYGKNHHDAAIEALRLPVAYRSRSVALFAGFGGESWSEIESLADRKSDAPSRPNRPKRPGAGRPK